MQFEVPDTMAESKRSISEQHRNAIAAGRKRSTAVREYLNAISAKADGRGRKRNPEALNARIMAIEEMLPNAKPLKRLHLEQEKINLSKKLDAAKSSVDIDALEEAFVEVARSYSDQQGISYSAWRAVGVPIPTLKRAGIARKMP